MLDTDTKDATAPEAVSRSVDAVIIGAGVAGLYQLYQLREAGLDVVGLEAASDVGGTWYWNRYPGCKFDSDSLIYQYLFDKDLYEGWTWSERFPTQPEIERWMHYITDRLDLRKDFLFDRAVTQASYDEDSGRWTVKTAAGDVIDAQFVIGCTGMLSAPLEDRFPGQKSFKGRIFHTARWPREEIDLTGKRVGVVGIGATGIQVIQTIADRVAQLKVFVRTPQYVLPMKNPKFGPGEVRAYKERFEEMQRVLPHTFTGFHHDFEVKWADSTPEQRDARIREFYEDGSLKLWLSGFSEIFHDAEVGEEVSKYVRARMAERLQDQDLIDVLVPTSEDYTFGTHRVPLESNYLEAYRRDNVEAISVKNNQIAEITPEGIKLQDGTLHELDVIILATGFDAGSGALSRIDITGRDGRKLRDEWASEIRTTLGMQKEGFPNFFMTGAPLAPSAALCNMTTCLQQQTEWITDCIGHVRAAGKSVIEPTDEGEEAWVRHHDEIAEATLIAKTNSWYTGGNVPGKPRRVLSYCGGVGGYRQRCAEAADSGYQGFSLQ